MDQLRAKMSDLESRLHSQYDEMEDNLKKEIDILDIQYNKFKLDKLEKAGIITSDQNFQALQQIQQDKEREENKKADLRAQKIKDRENKKEKLKQMKEEAMKDVQQQKKNLEMKKEMKLLEQKQQEIERQNRNQMKKILLEQEKLKQEEALQNKERVQQTELLTKQILNLIKQPKKETDNTNLEMQTKKRTEGIFAQEKKLRMNEKSDTNINSKKKEEILKKKIEEITLNILKENGYLKQKKFNRKTIGKRLFNQIIIMIDSKLSVLQAIFDCLKNTTGKDKYCRLMQYGSNFTAEFLLKNQYFLSNSDQKYQSLRNTGNAFSTARKVLRFGRHFELFKNFKSNIELAKSAKKNKNYKKYFYHILKASSNITYFFYLISDHYIYFEKFLQKNKKFLDFNIWINDIFWFIQECIDFLTNSMDMVQTLGSNSTYLQLQTGFLKLLMNIGNGLAAYGFFSDKFSRHFNVMMGFYTTIIWWHMYLINKINQSTQYSQVNSLILFITLNNCLYYLFRPQSNLLLHLINQRINIL